MALLNHAKKELSAKIVYYGPGLSGKTTNLEWIHRKLAPDKRGKLISLETKTDRTLFFDFLPVQIGEISGFRTRFNVYTVPGQIFYNETRRMVLKGVDGIVFVADSQKEMANENLENLRNLAENLRSIGKELSKIPLVIQYNKRDLPNILSVEEMNRLLNAPGLPFFEAVAVKGEGVLTTLTRVTRVVADHLRETLFDSPKEEASPPPPPPPPPAESSSQETKPSDSFPDSQNQSSKRDGPAFLAAKPDMQQGVEPPEPQSISNDIDLSTSSIETFQRSQEPVSPMPDLASAGAPAEQSQQREDIPSLGDRGESPHSTPSEPPISALASVQSAPPPAEVVTPPPPVHTATPEVPSQADPHEVPAKAYWVDPSVVTVAAQAVSAVTEPVPAAMEADTAPSAQKTVALRFGEPERETGNQVRIPVALRPAGSNELVSFQMVIRLEQGPESD
jgi:signal recognition particle receptor subunit beta